MKILRVMSLWIVSLLIAVTLVNVLFFRLFASSAFYGSDFFALAAVVFSIVPRFEMGLLSALPLHLPFLLFALTPKFIKWNVRAKVIYWCTAVALNAIWVWVFGLPKMLTVSGIVISLVCVSASVFLSKVIFNAITKRRIRKGTQSGAADNQR